MAWQPLQFELPEQRDEDLDLDVPGPDGESRRWHFRRVGKDSYLQIEGVDSVLFLPGLGDFSGLFPEPELRDGATGWLAATPPLRYLLQSSGESDLLGLQDVTCGAFVLSWYDLDREQWLSLEEDFLDGGDERFEPPSGAGNSLVLFVNRTSR